MLKKNQNVIASKLSDRLVILQMDSLTKDRAIELQGSGRAIWEIIEESSPTMEELHRRLGVLYENYGGADRKAVIKFVENLKNWDLISVTD